jgi:hypothetical protein
VVILIGVAQFVSIFICPGYATNESIAGLAVNFLLIESLQRFHQYYGDELQVECPTGSGDYMNLLQVAEEIQHRIIHIFGRDIDGRRALNGGNQKLDFDPFFRDYVWFYEVRYPITLQRPAFTDYTRSSTSTAMTVEVLGPRIRQDGECLSVCCAYGTPPKSNFLGRA